MIKSNFEKLFWKNLKNDNDLTLWCHIRKQGRSLGFYINSCEEQQTEEPIFQNSFSALFWHWVTLNQFFNIVAILPVEKIEEFWFYKCRLWMFSVGSHKEHLYATKTRGHVKKLKNCYQACSKNFNNFFKQRWNSIKNQIHTYVFLIK